MDVPVIVAKHMNYKGKADNDAMLFFAIDDTFFAIDDNSFAIDDKRRKMGAKKDHFRGRSGAFFRTKFSVNSAIYCLLACAERQRPQAGGKRPR